MDENLTIEEVEKAVNSLKNGKSSGADGIAAEHLKYGGSGIPGWLKRIFNYSCYTKYGLGHPCIQG